MVTLIVLGEVRIIQTYTAKNGEITILDDAFEVRIASWVAVLGYDEIKKVSYRQAKPNIDGMLEILVKGENKVCVQLYFEAEKNDEFLKAKQSIDNAKKQHRNSASNSNKYLTSAAVLIAIVTVFIVGSVVISKYKENTLNITTTDDLAALATDTRDTDEAESSVPTKEEIQQYNYILSKLSEDMSKTEDEILASNERKVGMTTIEMKEFINWVMPYATGFIPLENDVKAQLDFNKLISYAKESTEQITGETVSISNNKYDWYISKSLLRYFLRSNMTIGNIDKNVIIKIDFYDNTYTQYEVYQLKVDNSNVVLKTATVTTTETTTETATEITQEPTTEQAAKSTTESTKKPTNEQATQSTAEPTTNSSTEPTTSSTIKPIAVQTTEPTSITVEELETVSESTIESSSADTSGTTAQDTTEVVESNSEEVFYTPNGGSYHSSSACRTLSRSKVVLSGSLNDAIASGKDAPCKICY